MNEKKIIREEGLSFDDVLLKPLKSSVMPKSVDTNSRFSRNIILKIPIASAAMDTVTDSRLAIALAQQGGIGIIHRNFKLEEDQIKEVRRVKNFESAKILKPFTLGPQNTLKEAKELMGKKSISGIPITDKNNVLIGILTNRDIRSETDLDKVIQERMTRNLITAPFDTSLEEAEKILQKNKIEKLPLVDSYRKLEGLITFRDISKRKKFPLALKDSFGRLMVGAAIGVFDNAFAQSAFLAEVGVDVLVIDTAHGHQKNVLKTISVIKNRFPEVDLVAGNIATLEAAKDLIKAGVDGIKVGIGPGSICTTRIVAGVGVPQLTAILNCARSARVHNIPIIADGGIRFSGDVVKALAAGADSVMIGSLFAGTDEAPGEIVLYKGRTYKIYRGMGSEQVLKDRASDRYFHDKQDRIIIPEGVESRVSYRGLLADMVSNLVGGLRVGMGYLGAKNIKELQKKSRFIKISPASLKESHVHDVAMTRQPSNYWIQESEEES